MTEQKNAQDLLLDVLTTPDGLKDVLGNIQQRIGDARRKALAITSEATVEAVAKSEEAQAQATAVVAKATQAASEIRAQAASDTREVQRGRIELRDLESILARDRRTFEDKVKAFHKSVTAVFASWEA